MINFLISIVRRRCSSGNSKGFAYSCVTKSVGERTLHVSPMYWNPGNVYLWNLESLASKSVLKESGIPLIIGIKNPRLSWIILYGASLLRSAEAPRGIARVWKSKNASLNLCGKGRRVGRHVDLQFLCTIQSRVKIIA